MAAQPKPRGAAAGLAADDPRAARAVAFDLLRAVLRRRVPFDEALAASADLERLAPADRALARLIASTALRRLGQIDALIAACLDTPLKRGGRPAQDLLRIGIAQLIFADIAPHAALDTTVGLADPAQATPYRKLINAVLRRLTREGEVLLAETAPEHLNTPAWLRERWLGAFGADTADAIAAAHLRAPALYLTLRDQAAIPADAERLPGGAVRIAQAGRIEDLPGFEAGAWWVQDAAASLPAHLFGDLAGQRVLDLCAAPGGKTAQLIAAGGAVTALDASKKRMRRFAENLARLGMTCETVIADAADWEADTPFDAVLLDAPCSATGTIRRHPDIPWLREEIDIARLAALQRRMLRSAARLLKPGGTLVYAVCSLEPEEGEENARWAAEELPLTPAPIAPGELDGAAELIDAAGNLRTLPCHWLDRGGIDGFYAARFTRTAG